MGILRSGLTGSGHGGMCAPDRTGDVFAPVS
jgi:hypothetical protein